MDTQILLSLILSTTVATFASLIIYKHVRDLLAWREQALMAYKHLRMRQELVQFVVSHR